MRIGSVLKGEGDTDSTSFHWLAETGSCHACWFRLVGHYVQDGDDEVWQMRTSLEKLFSLKCMTETV